MENEEIVALSQHLYELRLEHRDIDDSIRALAAAPYVDQLQLVRMKKRKLLLKEEIVRLESKLIPDLNA